MLDPRVYRAAFLPAFFAVMIAAFSLANRPGVTSEALEPEVFDAARAFGTGAVPAKDSLQDLVRRFPDRRPGSAGDLALADRVEAAMRGSGFATRRLSTRAVGPDGRVDLQTVVASRAGVSSRRVVVLAHRDALGRGAAAELSATAALLEVARIAQRQELKKTLVLVSTSGGTIGGKAAREFAAEASDLIDAVLVLGDLAGTRSRKPWVVPWSNSARRTPLDLQRTVEAAVRREAGTDAGGARAAAQWLRLAVPYAYGEQAEIQREGIPAVFLGVSGERGPAADTPVDRERFVRMGRAALRAVGDLDRVRRAPDTKPRAILTRGKVLDAWVIRLLMGALLLPVLVAAVDAAARARRRGADPGRLLGWVAAWGVPVVLAWGWARLLDVVGIAPAPPGPVPPGVFAPEAAIWVAIASTGVLAVLALLLLRGRLRRGDLADGGAGAAVGVLLALCGLTTWALNPYALVLLLPALHGWLLLANGDGAARRFVAIPAFLIGLLPAAVLVWYYAGALGLGRGEAAWAVWLAVAGGHVSPLAVLGAATMLGCGLATIAVLRERDGAGLPPPGKPLETRGPLTYAGPGSLGGTTSALRQ